MEKINTRDFEISGFEYYSPGELIFKEGTKGDVIYLLLKGQVEISNMVEGRKVIVDKLMEGTLFGEVAFMDHHPRSATASALSNVTLAVVDRNSLVRDYRNLPNSLQVVFDAMARRLRRLTVVSSNLAGRQHERLPEKFQIKFSSREEFFQAYTVNVGGGGLFAATDQTFKDDEVLDFEFNLPGEQPPIQARGRVAWRQGPPESGIGLEFIDLNPDDKSRLAAYVRKAIEE